MLNVFQELIIYLFKLQYFDKTSEVFDKMIMGNRACNSFEAETKLINLEASQANLGNYFIINYLIIEIMTLFFLFKMEF